MKKNFFICLLTTILFTLVILSSCEKKNNYLEYEDFTSLFIKMNNEVKLDDYYNLGGNEGLNIVAIDDRLSFGRRSWLTLDNKQSEFPTQLRIEYMANNNSSMFTVDLIYLDKSLNDDLIYWNYPLIDNNDKNEFINNTYTENIISYKNILVKLSLFVIDSNKITDSLDNILKNNSLKVIEFIQSL